MHPIQCPIINLHCFYTHTSFSDGEVDCRTRPFKDLHSADTYPIFSTLEQSKIRNGGTNNTDCAVATGQSHLSDNVEGNRKEQSNLCAINIGVTFGVRNSLKSTVTVEKISKVLSQCDVEQHNSEGLDDINTTVTPISDITLTKSGTLNTSAVPHDSTSLQIVQNNTTNLPGSRDFTPVPLDPSNSTLEEFLADFPCPSIYKHQSPMNSSLPTSEQSATFSPSFHAMSRKKMNHHHTSKNIKKEEVVQSGILQAVSSPTDFHHNQDCTRNPSSQGSVMVSSESIAIIIRNEIKATLQVHTLLEIYEM